MSNTNNKTTNSRGILYGLLGNWILSTIFIFLCTKYFTVITIVLGIFHFFFGCLLILIFAQKAELIKLREAGADTADNILEDEDTPPKENALKNRFFNIENYIVSIRYSLGLGLITAGIIVAQVLILFMKPSADITALPPIWLGVLQIVLSFAYLMFTHWMFSKSKEIDEYEVYGLLCRCAQMLSFTTGTSVIISALGYNKLDRILLYAAGIFVIIILLDFLISCIQKIAQRESINLCTIKLNILRTILGKRNPDDSIVDMIEDKIGVSLRSSWTIKFVRKSIPIIIVFIVLILWGMTALVEIGPQSEGIVYRFGRIISEEPLTPGLHAKLPWPIDAVKTYPVYKTQYFTVGYESGENDDYLWTSVHGGEEYKLLLGDGKELVSINMTVHYNINDLTSYVTHCSKPEEILQAKAYEKMMKLIVTSDLDGLLSKDRAQLANTVMLQLQETSDSEKYGIEIMDVAITSIHPPVEVAASYQELVSADIQKQIIISQALMQRESAIPAAETKKDTIIKNALVDYEQRYSEAVSSATLLLADKEAYEYDFEAYKDRAWRSAFVAYLNARKFYIIDDTIIDGDNEIWMDINE